jgi:hypothetical protein
LGGKFTQVGTTPKNRNWLAAVSLDTGVPTDFQADVSGNVGTCASCISGDPYCGEPAVKALSLISTRLLVGGNFGTIRDRQRTHTRVGIAAIDINEELVDQTTYTQGVSNGYVSSIQFDMLFNTVYIGGSFQKIEGASRSCIAAFWVYLAIGGKGSGGATNSVFGYSDLGAKYLWKSAVLGGDAQAVDYYQNVVYVGTHDGMFTNGDKANGDAFKVAGLDLDTGKFLVDGAHQGKPCSKSYTDNCWVPVSDGHLGRWGNRTFRG